MRFRRKKYIRLDDPSKPLIQETQAETTQNKTAYDLIYLTACGANEVIPERKHVEAMDLASVHQMSQSLSLSALVYLALESAYDGTLPDAPLFRAWAREKDQAVYQNIKFEAEYQQLKDTLEKESIWYLPLKGVVLQNFYPQVGMRQMCDVDLLYDSTGKDRVRTWFLARGYEEDRDQAVNVDGYLKKPFYNFEMHRTLFNALNDPRWMDYYADIKDRLIKDPDNAYGYHFREEDFYLYLLVHMYKHYSTRGTGLRSLLDGYMFLKEKGDELDEVYLHRELKKLELTEFESKVRTLGRKVFSDPTHFRISELTEQEQNFLGHFLAFGTYGTLENRVRNQMNLLAPEEKYPSGHTKLQYIVRRLFPDKEVFKA